MCMWQAQTKHQPVLGRISMMCPVQPRMFQVPHEGRLTVVGLPPHMHGILSCNKRIIG